MTRWIDTSVFCGAWPFRSHGYRTPAALREYLVARGVTQAWVASAEAILYPDPMQGNEPLWRVAEGDPFFQLVPVIDVTLPTWQRDLRLCLEMWGCRAVKLVPNYHGYSLVDARVEELVCLVAECGVPICVQIRMMDERAHHPLMKVPGVPVTEVAELARRNPEARFLACGAYQVELKELSQVSNVWAELSFVESARTLVQAVGILGAERLVFGSHSPLLTFEAGAAKLNVDEDEVAAELARRVQETNAEALLLGSAGTK